MKKTTTHITAVAFDYGLKNIGSAVGQSLTQSAQPLTIFQAKDGIPNWEDVIEQLNEWQATDIIVGLPLNMNGSESDMSRRAKKFGNRLHGRTGLKVHFIDERLSTREAKAIAQEQGHAGNYGDAPIDEIAACLILEQWWQENPAT